MDFIKRNLLQLALIVATFSTLGSLVFSEILKFPPCVLCWYQRICMYPLVVILTVGIWKKDKNLHFYILPLSVTGLIISIYHNLLYYNINIVPESVTPCTLGISCTTKFIEWFGFITIPFLSMISFATIILLVLLHLKFSRGAKK